MRNELHRFNVFVALCLIKSGIVKDIAYYIIKMNKITKYESVLTINDDCNLITPIQTNARAIDYYAPPAEETLSIIANALHEYKSVEILSLHNVFFHHKQDVFDSIVAFLRSMPRLLRLKMNALDTNWLSLFQYMPEFAYYTFDIDNGNTVNMIHGTKRIELL